MVDDEEKLRTLVKLYLEPEGYTFLEAKDGTEAIEIFNTNSIDLIILDLMLPKIDGFQVCRTIRQTSSIPIIMLTARSEDADKVLGFQVGSDDYLVKPFSPLELVARVKALFRRVNNYNQDKNHTTILTFNSLEIDSLSHEVKVNYSPINLSPKEFDLLLFLIQNPNQVFSRDQLLNQVWNFDYYGDSRTVDTHIKRIREKINALDSEFNAIKTVWGIGYKFEVQR